MRSVRIRQQLGPSLHGPSDRLDTQPPALSASTRLSVLASQPSAARESTSEALISGIVRSSAPQTQSLSLSLSRKPVICPHRRP